MFHKITFAALLAVSALVAACNTMEGAGRDVQRAGTKLENSAERNK